MATTSRTSFLRQKSAVLRRVFLEIRPVVVGKIYPTSSDCLRQRFPRSVPGRHPNSTIDCTIVLSSSCTTADSIDQQETFRSQSTQLDFLANNSYSDYSPRSSSIIGTPIRGKISPLRSAGRYTAKMISIYWGFCAYVMFPTACISLFLMLSNLGPLERLGCRICCADVGDVFFFSAPTAISCTNSSCCPHYKEDMVDM